MVWFIRILSEGMDLDRRAGRSGLGRIEYNTRRGQKPIVHCAGF